MSEPVAAFRRSDAQLAFTKTIASLALSIAAQKHFKAGDYVGAIQLFGASLEVAEETERFATELIYKLRGLSYFALNQYALASVDLSESLRRVRNVESLSNRGIALLAAGSAKDALRDFNEALTLDPQSVLVLTNRASALSALNLHGDAIRDLSRVIALSPEFAAAYYNRGNSYFSVGTYEKAIRDYDAALSCDPQFAAAMARKAYTLDAVGEFAGAMAEYERAMELDPSTFAYAADAAKTKLHLRDANGAIGLCNRALSMSASNVDVRQTRGIAFYQAGDSEGALADFDGVLKQRVAPVASDFVNRALAYRGLGDIQNAIRDYESASELARSDENLKAHDEIIAEIELLKRDGRVSPE